MVPIEDLAGIPSVPEARLPAALLQRLPDDHPVAPWRCRLDATVWLHRLGPPPGHPRPEPASAQLDARGALPGELRHARPLLAVAGFLRYTDSPVGPYAEAFGGLLLQRRIPVLHVVFMAVDSLPSLRAGRAEWALPKTPAKISGDPGGPPGPGGAGGGPHALHAAGEGWWLAASARSWGPAVPAAVPLVGAQVSPEGRVVRYRGSLRGRVQPAAVTASLDARSSLAGWLRPGRHLGSRWTAAALHLQPATSA